MATAIVVIASASMIGLVTEAKHPAASDAKTWSLRGNVSSTDRAGRDANLG